MSSTLPSVYLQTCSVCKAGFNGTHEWLNHLVQEYHQILARKECLEYWDRKIRKSCLIIFTKVPLNQFTAGEIVNHFSYKLSSSNNSKPINIVTDFVWWEDRPHIGILQFESKKKVNDVLIAAPKTMQIDGSQRIQVKAGSELTSLEWYAILPPISPQIDSQPVNRKNMETLSEDVERPPKRPKLDDTVIMDTSTPQQSQLINMSSILCSGRPPPSAIMSPLTHPLQFEFWAIRKSMIIRDVQFEYVTSAARSLKMILSKLDPNLEVSLFRNWFLKLKYQAANNVVLLYVHSNKASKNSNTLCKHVGNTKHRDFKVLKSRKEGQRGLLYLKHVPSKENIFLVTSTSKGCLMEVQVCRLMEYMCQFDPRCYSLITLACYWVKLNSIQVGGTMDNKNEQELHPQYTIQWLVLYFMYYRTFNFIPTPQQIIKRCGDISNGGFRSDPEFVKEWKSQEGERLAARKQLCVGGEESSEEFISSVLTLFKIFLLFCGGTMGCDDNELILNMCNGTLITKCSNLTKHMTPEEIHQFRAVVNEDKTKEQLLNRGFYMTNPISLTHTLSISENIISQFKYFGESGGNLQRFFSCVENIGVEGALKEMGGLKAVLTI